MSTSWNEQENALVKTFKFENFLAAVAFVNKVAAVAQELQHHPDILIKDYNHVVITTTTHDAGSAVTAKDHALAEAIDAITLPTSIA